MRSEDLATMGNNLGEVVTNFKRISKEHGEWKAKVEASVKDVPETADGYKISIPSDVPAELFKDEDRKSFKELAKKLGITQSALNELISFETGRTVAVRKASNDARLESEKKLKADLIETYKDKADSELEGAFRLVEQVGGKELKEELEKGQGNNPRLIKAFVKLSKLFSEKGITPSGDGGGDTSGPNLARLYPKSAAQMGLKT
jgi:hypothetical protein